MLSNTAGHFYGRGVVRALGLVGNWKIVYIYIINIFNDKFPSFQTNRIVGTQLVTLLVNHVLPLVHVIMIHLNELQEQRNE